MGQANDETMTPRKGPWTEHEDLQLVFHVHMFGDRRWDFIASVSGLKRSGKSCRLRWVNYLNPGLKRGKLAPHEQRLVLELHSKFGNRWSKIARKLPGRTDNEIKNYWRTHMRKRAQEKKATTSGSSSRSPSLSQCSSSSSMCTSHPSAGSMPTTETKERSFYDTGGVEILNAMQGKDDNKKRSTTNTRVNHGTEGQDGYYSMDEIWKDIDSLEDDNIDDDIKPFFEHSYSVKAPLTWDICMGTSWTSDGQEEFTNNHTFHLPAQLQVSSGLVMSNCFI